MQFNNTTNKSGLIQSCEDYLGLDDGDIANDTNLLKRFTRLLNERYKVVSVALNKNSTDWEYDDTNQTTLPSATTDLVDGQQDYTLPSTAQEISRVEIMDINGNYYVLNPFSEAQIPGTAMTEFFKNDGAPQYYDLKGRSVILYPAPAAGSVTLTAGIKVYVARDVVEFNSTATTQEPGFDKRFHLLLPLGACIDYGVGKDMNSVVKNCVYLYGEIMKSMEGEYNRRHGNSSKAKINPSTDKYI
jgi:hypothetical protein